MLRLFLLISVFFIGPDVSFCQSGKSTFYPEGYGMLYQRKNINFVSINTENQVEPFLKALDRELGSPIITGEYIIYKYINRRLSDKKIVIRISQAIQLDMDNKKSNNLFIYVETTDQEDLLRSKKLASKELKTYFSKLFLKEVVPAPMDTFNEH